MATTVSINSQVCKASTGSSLFSLAEDMGLTVPSSCHQQGKCRECMMEITSGMECLTAPAKEENHLREGFRLSCLCRIASDEGAVCAHTLGRGQMQIEDRAVEIPRTREPAPIDPAVRREGNKVLLENEPLAETDGPVHGVAIDLGTTTVALRVINLENGHQVASAAFENPQRFGGSDIMARIQYDSEHPGRMLQRTLLGYLSRTLMQLPVDPRTIYEFVVAGNSTMRDLFFGLDVHSIGQKPYRSLTEQEWRAGKRPSTALSCSARSLRLPSHPKARVYGLPLVSGHVGGDAAACLIALEPHHRDKTVAMMDLGTNTELVIGNRDKLMVASCPAGPAFEGRGISCGMAGIDGAIARVSWTDSAGWKTQVIGGGTPGGICGSGLIDLLSELLRSGQMNHLGRFESGEQATVIDKTHGIQLLESDINELAQAKGANVAGLRIVSQHYGCPLEDLDTFYLAGGFGRHLDVLAARNIGLIPNLPEERIVSVGNLAIEGATLALLSLNKRRELEQLIRNIVHVELETDPEFFDHFVQGCQFGPLSSEMELFA